MTDFSIDSTQITDLQGATVNDQDVVDTMITEIVAQHDAAFHKTTGHSHDGTTGNAPSLSSGVGSLTIAELGRLMLMGGYI